jgi:hypothetical protein
MTARKRQILKKYYLNGIVIVNIVKIVRLLEML